MRERELKLFAAVRGGDMIGGAGKTSRIVGCFRAVIGCGKGSNALLNVLEIPAEMVRSRKMGFMRGGEVVELDAVGHSHVG